MSLEFFGGFDAGEGMSEAAFEAFKEKMKKAQAQIAALLKEEKKRRKKESELIAILLKFIRGSHKHKLILLISRALEKNIPANFILALVLLGNEDIQKELNTPLALPGQVTEENSKALVFFQQDKTMPLKARIEMDNWLKNLLLEAEAQPERLLITAYEVIGEEKEIRSILIQLTSYLIEDYLSQKELDGGAKNTEQFSAFILKGILDKTRENYENRAQLAGETA